MSQVVEDLKAGTKVAGYTIDGVAGYGGMGVVYRALQERPHRTVALKVISPEFAGDVEFRSRFEREADIAASIEHPNVIPLYEFGDYEGLLYLAMRYVVGEDLRSWVVANGPMPPARAARVISQVGEALDAAHAEGLVHRDVKPGNVLLTESSGHDHAYLTDFGLTKESSSAAGLTKTGTWVGTADYVAPEQIRGEAIDARADVYSLGCVMFHLLVGQVPFERESEVSKIFAHLNEPPPSLAQVAPHLARFDTFFAKAMAKEPAGRFVSAGDLGRAAIAVAEMRPVELTNESVGTGPAAPRPEGDETPVAHNGAPSESATPPQSEAVTPPPEQQTPPPQEAQVPPVPPQGNAAPSESATSPPTETPPTTSQVPPTTPPPEHGGSAPPRPRGRRPLVIALACVGALLVAGGAAAVLLSGSSGPSDKKKIQQTVETFFSTSGSAGCDLVSPAYINRNFGDIGTCRTKWAGVPNSNLSGTQSIAISGSSATVTGITVDGHPNKVNLVKAGSKWLIEEWTDLDQQAAQSQTEAFNVATGPPICDFFTDRAISSFFGSMDACRRKNANQNNPIAVKTHDSFSYKDQTTANDSVTLDDGSKWKYTLIKQSGGSWLIDDIVKA